MAKTYHSDRYYIRSGDFAVISTGVFPDTPEGDQESWDAADASAAESGARALVYLTVDDLLNLMDDLERAFNATHADTLTEEE